MLSIPKSNFDINVADPDLAAVTLATWKAIEQVNSQPFLFLYFGKPALCVGKDDGSVTLETLNVDLTIHLLSQVALWHKFVRGEEGQKRKVRARPTHAVARDFLATPNPGLPILSRVTQVPIFAHDGTLIQEPGYYPAYRILYAPDPGLRVSRLPDDLPMLESTAARALAFFRTQLLVDFPFVSDADFCHAICAAILPFVRLMIDGPVPLHLISKPTPGTGGSLLAELLALPIVGRNLASTSAPKDESEMARTLTALLGEDPPIVLLDNIDKKLDSPALASALTSHRRVDRDIGTSRTISALVRALFIATGNNPSLSAEMARRITAIRLDAKIAHPELRAGFKHDDIMLWALERRSVLIRFLLAFVQLWVRRGCPRGTRPLGKFEAWAGVMGGIVEANGISGFLDNLEEFREIADHDTTSGEAFVLTWLERYGTEAIFASDLLEHAEGLELRGNNAHAQATRMGKWLEKMAGQVVTGYRIERAGIKQGRKLWRLHSCS
jgi:putative DNA primase/helicase